MAVLTWEAAEQIYNIRILLEQEAARDCAKLAKKSDKTLLKKQLSQISAASQEHDDLRRVEASQAVFEHLTEAAALAKQILTQQK